MQNRYAGDIGDYVKLGLLRALSGGLRVGVAWYLYPDEGHNLDGRHTAYLQRPLDWRALDPELFDGLTKVVRGARSVAALERLLLLDATYSRESLNHGLQHASARCSTRADWFCRVRSTLADCDLVFADPDNGLTDDRPERRSRPRFGKHMPISEALEISRGRCAVIYHHNSRFRGGHDAEVEHWRRQLGPGTLAVRANAYSCRTFFILNPTPEIRVRAESFANRWHAARVRMHA